MYLVSNYNIIYNFTKERYTSDVTRAPRTYYVQSLQGRLLSPSLSHEPTDALLYYIYPELQCSIARTIASHA